MWKHKKQFGQHFLTDGHAILKMCEVSNIQEEDIVLEIGPGKGVLTASLLEYGATVYAIEKDNDLIPFLEEKFKDALASKKLIIVHKDIRDIESSDLPQKEYKLVANIPYYITGEIIRTFLTSLHQPTSITLLVQEEVARRICSETKTNLLQLSVRAYGEPKYVKKVKAGSFNPPPRVDSAIMHIANISRNSFKGIDEEKFFEVLHVAFNQKRKTILKTLGTAYGKERMESILEDEVSPSKKARPEEVALADWLYITQKITAGAKEGAH